MSKRLRILTENKSPLELPGGSEWPLFMPARRVARGENICNANAVEKWLKKGVWKSQGGY